MTSSRSLTIADDEKLEGRCHQHCACVTYDKISITEIKVMQDLRPHQTGITLTSDDIFWIYETETKFKKCRPIGTISELFAKFVHN